MPRVRGTETKLNYDRITRLAAIISYFLLLLSNFRYVFGRRSPWDPDHNDDVAFTAFTANIVCVVFYFIITAALQLSYLVNHFYVAPRLFNLVFIYTNCISLLWSYFFARSHYIVSEILAVINFLVLLAAYLFGQAYTVRPLANWISVNGAVVVMPLVWNHYLMYWNGAVMIGINNLATRIISNVFIWEFLVSPAVLMLITGDYFLGFTDAYLVGAIGIGQLFTRVFALQWIFAFVICGSLVSLSMFFAFVRPPVDLPRPSWVFVQAEVDDDAETSPLLTDS